MNWYDLLFVLMFLAGLVLLEKGADLFTDKIGELGERTGISETVLGMLTAGMEWEELLVSLVAAFSGNIGIAVGNVIGANIANILGTFSLGPIIRPLRPERDDRNYAMLLALITTGVALLIFWNPTISRPTGGILVVAFLIYVGILLWTLKKGLVAIRFEREEDDDDDQRKDRSTAALFALAFLGLGIILVGAELVVESSVHFASRLGISEYIIGLTIVAIGTTVPDKVITIAGAVKGQSGIVLANMIGSNIFNLLFVLGLAALVQPVLVDTPTLNFDVPVLVGITWLVLILLFKQQIGRTAGILLMTGYVGYLAFNFIGK